MKTGDTTERTTGAADAGPVAAGLTWRCREHAFDVAGRVLVMGVVNITPDSFSDGGRFLDPTAAIAHARGLRGAGADVLDLGAESTRPGSEPVAAAEQLRRLMPVIETLVAEGACVSIDTASAEVARAALAAGAHAINDVTALGDPGMGAAVAQAGAGLVLMHMQGTPATMQHAPRYDDVAREVREFLAARLAAALAGDIAAECVALDPGIGFGKTLEDNLRLIARLDEFASLGRPVVLGASRKSFLGRLLDGAPADERLEAGLAAAAIGVFAGARIVRTHDVAATVRALRVAAALAAARREG
jgi:dihydropteroate synthase